MEMIEKINTEEEYREALKRFLELYNIPASSPLLLTKVMLAQALEEYEKSHLITNN